jgi:hypothetical protein
MKEIKLKKLWAVDVDNIQMKCFKYKKDAICYAKKYANPYYYTIVKRNVLTDKY